MGELENTYIIYTADHGIAVGRHGLVGSRIYMNIMACSFIVSGPGIKAGTRAKK